MCWDVYSHSTGSLPSAAEISGVLLNPNSRMKHKITALLLHSMSASLASTIEIQLTDSAVLDALFMLYYVNIE